MYLLDTNVISECRKAGGGDEGVQRFIRLTDRRRARRYLSVITLGELQRGVSLLRYRNDKCQAALIESWLETLRRDHAQDILPVDLRVSNVWARLRVPHQQHPVDKLIAATALVHQLVVVTRNVKDFADTGVEVYNPFLQSSGGPASASCRLTADSPPRT
ncbi:type II toxin-antitoxin system VapC family toxin [Pandoraea pnomenusa]|uniref:type II toxin-antitoxin system VapC family toxin n=1 Tax=Pandoraea pnomenusa TaxID=93220 RepID=UPI0033403009